MNKYYFGNKFLWKKYLSKKAIPILLIIGMLGMVLYVSTNNTKKKMYNQLTRSQNIELMEWYHLECSEKLETISPDTAFAFKATEETNEVIEQLKFFVFAPKFSVKIASDRYRKMVEKANEARRKYIFNDGNVPGNISSDIDFILDYPYQAYRFYRGLPKELKKKMTIRIDGLNLMQFIQYCVDYFISREDDGYIMEYTGTEPLHTTKQTEAQLIRIRRIWDPLSDLEEDVRKEASMIALEYGLTVDNMITAEWVMENPNQAYHFFTRLPVEVVSFENPISWLLGDSEEVPPEVWERLDGRN